MGEVNILAQPLILSGMNFSAGHKKPVSWRVGGHATEGVASTASASLRRTTFLAGLANFMHPPLTPEKLRLLVGGKKGGKKKTVPEMTLTVCIWKIPMAFSAKMLPSRF